MCLPDSSPSPPLVQPGLSLKGVDAVLHHGLEIGLRARCGLDAQAGGVVGAHDLEPVDDGSDEVPEGRPQGESVGGQNVPPGFLEYVMSTEGEGCNIPRNKGHQKKCKKNFNFF